MFGFKRKEWKHAYKEEISYFKELVTVGCLLALIMCALVFMAGIDDDPSLSFVKEPESSVGEDEAAERRAATPEPTAPPSRAESPGAGAIVSDGALDGIDPLATPEVFDRYDALDVLGGVAAHVPSELSAQTQRRETPAPRAYVVVDKAEHTLTLFRGDEVVRQYGIAVGKNPGDKVRAGDNRTPEGDFPVQQIHDAAYWVHDFGDGNGEVEGAYGPLFIRLNTPNWKGIGIHGTHDPDSIGTDATEGCVRMQNDDLLEFADAIEIGTTVTIR
jgi:hypothetical protein